MKVSKILITGGSGFIGTHLVDSLLAKGIDLINIDIKQPKRQEHYSCWRNCNILDNDNLERLFKEYQPSFVVHLAARATIEGKTLADFQDNTVGTDNVMKAIKKEGSVSRVIVTSSQHVRKPGSGLPKHDEDYAPHGLYGESKVITETSTRKANLCCDWVIIRPTTVWGPWHPTLPGGLWAMMKKGIYFHPKNDPVIRSYGYVKNIVWQIENMLEAPSELLNHKVFYVGDSLTLQINWINTFSKAITKRNVPQVPKELIKLLAWIGDGLSMIGIKFPMDSPRYFNLTTTNPVPLEPIFEAFGVPPYSLAEGQHETIVWLEEHGYV